MTAEEAGKAKPAKAAKAVKPKAPTTTRMRVYGGGMSLAFGASFLAFGYQLLNGVDAFTAAVWAFFTFFAIGVVSWFMALTLGPASTKRLSTGPFSTLRRSVHSPPRGLSLLHVGSWVGLTRRSWHPMVLAEVVVEPVVLAVMVTSRIWPRSFAKVPTPARVAGDRVRIADVWRV